MEGSLAQYKVALLQLRDELVEKALSDLNTFLLETCGQWSCPPLQLPFPTLHPPPSPFAQLLLPTLPPFLLSSTSH